MSKKCPRQERNFFCKSKEKNVLAITGGLPLANQRNKRRQHRINLANQEQEINKESL
jgi:hypothetical protein